MQTKLNTGAMLEAINTVESITPSVLIMARVAGVKPADFAKALSDDEANSTYSVGVVETLQKELVKKAVEQRKAEADEK